MFLGTIQAAVRIHSTPAKPRRATRISSIFLSQRQRMHRLFNLLHTLAHSSALHAVLWFWQVMDQTILFKRLFFDIGVLEPCHITFRITASMHVVSVCCGYARGFARYNYSAVANCARAPERSSVQFYAADLLMESNREGAEHDVQYAVDVVEQNNRFGIIGSDGNFMALIVRSKRRVCNRSSCMQQLNLNSKWRVCNRSSCNCIVDAGPASQCTCIRNAS